MTLSSLLRSVGELTAGRRGEDEEKELVADFKDRIDVWRSTFEI